MIKPLHAVMLLAVATLVITGCTDSTPPKGSQSYTQIPVGAGKWVRVAQDIPLETMVGKRVVLPYGPAVLAANSDKSQVVTYSIAFTADPFAANDRCAMTVVALLEMSGDGSIKEVPAKGTVIDNSDSQPGFRIDFSQINAKQLVIPAGATATVIFSESVVLPSGKNVPATE